ncbi:chemotaxis protein CheW [Inquilinus sp.]|jgi:purine-binding chemotaxis protein CheW|uniref:chemotaxis protein CheW n=1 Tax=Inquilinus sp. TaxID=1932117 RepID=UPI003782DFF6
MPEAGPRPAGGDASLRRFLTFRSGTDLYALPAEEVLEIIHVPPVAHVPQATKSLMGLANLRGDVLPVASLASLLGRGRADAAPTSRAIVLAGASPVALAVDAVEALVTVEARQVETRQSKLAAGPGERLHGAFKVEGRQAAIAKVLDIQFMLAAAFVARSRPRRGPASGPGAPVASPAPEDAGSRQQLVTFDVAGQEFALALDAVEEIVPGAERVTAIPHSEALIRGVTPYRDTLLPLFSLRGLLGFAPATEAAGREKIIVSTIGGVLVGLVADRMRSIIAADRELVEPLPPVLAARMGGESRVHSIYRADDGSRLVSILAPDRLFQEDVMQRLGGGDRPAAPAREAAGQELEFVVFRLGEDEFGLPIDVVDEIARVPDRITRVPKAPKFLEGVINLRGDVLPLVDQRRRFDMPKLAAGAGRHVVVVRTERHRAGLIVDSVSGVLRVAADTIEPAPDLTGEATRLVHSVVNLEAAGRLVLLLDPAELLSRSERSLLDAFASKTKRADP